MLRTIFWGSLIIASSLIVLSTKARADPGLYQLYLPMVSQGYYPGTATSTPTATRTATATPTATPMPVEILENQSVYTNTNLGTLSIFGEVRNSSAQHLSNIAMPIWLLDNMGQTISTGSGQTLLRLPANETICFELSISYPVTNTWISYHIGSPVYTMWGSRGFSTTLVQVGLYLSNLSIDGFVRNDDNIRHTSIFAYGTHYDSKNRVVGCNFGYVGSLDPGQLGKVVVLKPSTSAITSFKIQFESVQSQ